MNFLDSAFTVIFENASVAGIPLLAFVLGFVQWLKGTFSMEGKKVNLASMITGVVFGCGYQLTLGFPTDFGGWFGLGVFGIALGLVSSGIYDAAKQTSKHNQ